jgi:hypothetical protein
MTAPDDRRDLESQADNWLDGLLEEALGGQGPPDLKDEILDRWLRRAPLNDVACEEVVAEPPTIVVRTSERVLRRVGQRRQRSLLAWLVGGGTCILAFAAMWAAYHRGSGMPQIAPVARGNSAAVKPRQHPPVAPPDRSEQRLPAPSITPDSATSSAVPPAATAPSIDRADSPPAAADPPADDNSPDRTSEPAAPLSPTRIARLDDAEVIKRINQQLRQRWQDFQVVPAVEVADDVWCKRVYQQLIGREPNATELREFLRNSSADRRVAMVDRLLSGPHSDEFGRYWSQRWTNWLLEGIRGNSRAFRTGLQNYLAAALTSNRPYRQIWTELVAASGTNDPQRSDFSGATNYLLALRENSTAADVAGQLCRLALGRRVACAQCHDDTLRGRSQQDFWQLAATINAVEVEVLRPGRGRLRDTDPTGVKLSYVRHDGRAASASPGGLDGRLLASGTDQSLRAQLAAQLVESPDFPRQAVNRFWEAMLQYGFTHSVDDLAALNPVTHPDLVAMLSEQFAAHDYQLKDLMRWVALSDAMNRSDAISSGNVSDAPTEGGVTLFSRSYHRPTLFMRSEQGLAQLADGRAPRVTYAGTEEERGNVVGLYRTDPSSSPTDAHKTAAIGVSPNGQLLPTQYFVLIRRFAETKLAPEQQFDHAYRVVLGRSPTPDEQALSAAILQAANGDATAATERLFWVLLNTARP